MKKIQILKEPMADMEAFNVSKKQLMRMIDGYDINIPDYEKKTIQNLIDTWMEMEKKLPKSKLTRSVNEIGGRKSRRNRRYRKNTLKK